MTTRRRLPLWKLAAILLVGLAALAGVVLLWIDSVGARRRAEMEGQVRRLHAEVRARSGLRPPIRGEAIPGSAWDDYELAISGVDAAIQRAGTQWWTYPRLREADQSKLDAFMRSQASVLDPLTRGARRTDGNYPYAWEDGLHPRTPDFDGCTPVAHFAVRRAELLAKEGRVLEASQLMMDVLQFSRDLDRNSIASAQRSADAVSGIPLPHLKEFLCEGKFKPGELSTLARELDLIDRFMSENQSASTNSVLSLGFELLKPEQERGQSLQIPRREYARYLFSKRIGEAEGFERVLNGVRKADSVRFTSWNQIESFMILLSADVGIPHHPLVQRTWVTPFWTMQSNRGLRARLRLLRMAAHFRATGEVLDLDDPFGDKMKTRMEGRRLKAWTVWLDGKDDQGDEGDGGWLDGRPMPIRGKPPRPVLDIVVEVER